MNQNKTTIINAIKSRIRFYEQWAQDYERTANDKSEDFDTRRWADNRRNTCEAQAYALRMVLEDLKNEEVRA